jgi:hypothetical protein
VVIDPVPLPFVGPASGVGSFAIETALPRIVI